MEFLVDAFRHYKTIGAEGDGSLLLEAAGISGARAHPEAGAGADPAAGIVVGNEKQASRLRADFVKAMRQDRHLKRGLKPPIPA
jgi:hypothetical protein